MAHKTTWHHTKNTLRLIAQGPKPTLKHRFAIKQRLLEATTDPDPTTRQEAKKISQWFIEYQSRKCSLSDLPDCLKPIPAPAMWDYWFFRPFIKEQLKKGPLHLVSMVELIKQKYPNSRPQTEPRTFLRDFLPKDTGLIEVSPNTYALKPKPTRDHVERVESLATNPTKQSARNIVNSEFIKTQKKGSHVQILSLTGPLRKTEQDLVNTGYFGHVRCISVEWDKDLYPQCKENTARLNATAKNAEYVSLFGRDRDCFMEETPLRDKLRISEGIDGIWLDWMCRVTKGAVSTLSLVAADSRMLWNEAWLRGANGFLAVTLCDNGQQSEEKSLLENLRVHYKVPKISALVDKLNGVSLILNHHALGLGVQFVPTRYASYRNKSTSIMLVTWTVRLGPPDPAKFTLNAIETI